MGKIIVNTGDRYGMLTVLSELEPVRIPSGQVNRVIECKCDCGNNKVVRLLHLVRDRVTNCGCKRRTKNGESHSVLYKRYKAMCERCYDSNNIGYKLYGGRGISVCEQWLKDYSSFKEWVISNGYNESLQLDRIDTNGNYSPENCRFVTSTVNANNKRTTLLVDIGFGEIPFMDVIRLYNFPENSIHTIRRRIKSGWSHKEAFETKVREGNYKKANA